MKHICVMAAVIAVSGCISYTAASPSEDLFEWVTISDPGNPAFDRPTTSLIATGRGSVDYEYRIARNEVSTQQYLTFVNTFATQSDALASRIGLPSYWGGTRDLSYNGPGERYVLRSDVTDAGQLPIIGISWRDAALFVNWMNNDLSSDPTAIDNGAYDASTFGGDPQSGYTDQSYRNSDARYFLPNYDEWIKAAHYDPDKHGDGQGGWWMFNNGSDEAAIPGAPGEGETSAGWLVNGSSNAARDTPLGSYPATVSPWGLLDVSGGGSEWTESWSPFDTTANRNRIWQGASAGTDALQDSLDYPAASWPAPSTSSISFRVASTVPTPGTMLWITVMIAIPQNRRKRNAQSLQH